MSDTRLSASAAAPRAANTTNHRRIVFASFIGTAIEFYDFYVYATAAALVIGPVFFPHGSATAQALSAFVTFGIAFIARPIGSFLFGHFGDRIGRKSTLVASLLVMGVSTTAIGFVPGYDAIGALAPVLLCVLRFGQGIGLGGEWGGAALLATEHAPAGKRGWFGMFPQLGPSIGFLASNGLFFALALTLSDEQFRSWGWRIPFLVSAALVAVGLYVRLKIAETPAFQAALDRHERVRVPLAALVAHHWQPTLLGALAMVVCYTLFYISTVFSLSYGVSTLHFSRQSFLGLLCFAVLFMALATPLAAAAADRFGRKPVLIAGAIAALLSGFTMAPLLGSGSMPLVALFLTIELFLMGVTFAPMGALLPELFPTNVRYTGAGVAYNLGGILGVDRALHRAVACRARRTCVGRRLRVGRGGDQPRRRAADARNARCEADISRTGAPAARASGRRLAGARGTSGDRQRFRHAPPCLYSMHGRVPTMPRAPRFRHQPTGSRRDGPDPLAERRPRIDPRAVARRRAAARDAFRAEKLARHRGRSARGKPRGHCGRDRVRIIDVLSVPVRRPRPPPAHIAATRRGCSTAPVG
ncbi:sugar (and other) transporter family protein [Burkholderia pseudomallei MSHR840]|nr:sugar (and other) transporter family protein [Burkholderia pseudomallei MSHR840]